MRTAFWRGFKRAFVDFACAAKLALLAPLIVLFAALVAAGFVCIVGAGLCAVGLQRLDKGMFKREMEG